ncbi:MAG: SpoIIE family protein phosphatase [Spirochaetia bacterium]|nr:SpoIIE family protein phosphatase [Spirochaetia bacterium]
MTEKEIKSEYYFDAKKFNEYLNSIIHQWSKTLTAMGFTLVPIFGILDFFTMPTDKVTLFWQARLINAAILVAQHFLIRHTKPGKYSSLHGYFAAIITSLFITQMTVELGGFNSSYFQGLNLVIIGVNLLIPWRFMHSAFNGLSIISIYIAFNLMSGIEFDVKILANNLFFMSATVVISVSINYVRHNLIKREFQLRKDINAAREALWGEMEIAKKIQTALLPENIQLPGYEVSAIMKPAEEVGGDYYDIIKSPEGDMWLSIGDVSGHGVESGLIMMMNHTCLDSLASQSSQKSPSQMLEKINYVMKENISKLKVNRYMSLSLLKLGKDHFLHSGKHQDILIYRLKQNKIEIIKSIGTWIAIIDNIGDYLKDEKVLINEGDIILLYTDGVTEAENINNQMFGFERLIESFQKYAKLPVNILVENIVHDVLNFQNKQDDDITVLACKKL